MSEGRGFGRCARHPDEPGIALCRRCGDSACGRCALAPVESLCLACEERALKGIEDRLRRRLWFRSWAWVILLPLALGATAQWAFPRVGVWLRVEFYGAAFVLGFGIGVLLALAIARQAWAARGAIGPWVADGRAALEERHGRYAAAAEAERAELGGALEEERSAVFAELLARAPGVMNPPRARPDDPTSNLWLGVVLLALGGFRILGAVLPGKRLWSVLKSFEGLSHAAFIVVGLGLVIAWLIGRTRPEDSEASGGQEEP